ncbi:MAG: hypothetical protein QXX91_03360 [Thermoplasmata archaeon]
MKNSNKKRLVFVLIISFVLVLSLNIISAEFWACFSKGERINYCNPNIPDRTASSDNYRLCMSYHNNSANCYSPGNWNVCNTLPPTCVLSGNGSNIDRNPPIFTLKNPINGTVFTERKINLTFMVNEKSDVYYLDLINGRGKWTRVCNDCMSYSRFRSFKEGLNQLRFKAVDRNDNEAFFDISFFIDSQDPKVSATNPRRGFANGYFDVIFSEENPMEVTLHYGNIESGMNEKNLNINSECQDIKTRKLCGTNVDLSQYDGEQIEYWFRIMDIAGNIDESKPIFLNVDSTSPIINSINYTIDKNRVTFMIEVNEINFDSINYIDNSDSRPKWRTMCTRLNNGMCIKRLTLKYGEHSLNIQAKDKAGNTAETNIVLTV